MVVCGAPTVGVVAPAIASEPSAGTVSPSSRTTSWQGDLIAPDLAYAATGGTHGACAPPHCDTFTLTVRGGKGKDALLIEAQLTSVGQAVTIEVVAPDGTTSFAGGLAPASARSVSIPRAADGDYTVRISGGSIQGELTYTYSATASLGDTGVPACRALRSYAYETGGAPIGSGPTNDPLYRYMHAHRQMGVVDAWARGGRGQGAIVAVLDTGVDLNHPDLRDNLVPGVDLLDGTESDCAPGPADQFGHGTLVSGVIAAVAGNGVGIAGVAPRARIMPVRVCDQNGSCPPDAIDKGIRWATDHGAAVINMSLGADEVDLVLGLAPLADLSGSADDIAYAVEHGVVVVAAAGNNTWPLCAHPGADPGAVCVAAVDRDGLPTEYSNLPFDSDGEIDAFRAFGGSGTTCDTLAVSTHWPGAGLNKCGTAYAGATGTSLATPQVAGAAAILRSFGVPGKEVVARLEETASNGGAYDPIMGFGIPDVDAATRGLSPLPDVRPAAEAGSPRKSVACRRARASLKRATARVTRARRSVRRHRTRASRRALDRALRARTQARAMVRKRCAAR
jgi:serine protease